MASAWRLAASFAALAGIVGLAACSETSGAETARRSAAAGLDTTRLPLGDGRRSSAPRRGYVYSCQRFVAGGPGASAEGPWIDRASSTWSLSGKISVAGSVRWPGRFAAAARGTRLRLTGNGLPSHSTGVFPVAASDPAYRYDRNPNSIRASTVAASLPRTPRRARRATCVGGTVGVMRSGAPLYSAFDAAGRDAVAHEVQDRCDGHPQMRGQYHYHSLSDCLADAGSRRSHSRRLGWALDGFGIYGKRGVGGVTMSTARLDACHGHTHAIAWNGRRVRMYHYHATDDFPYTVACYRGTPIGSATGLGAGGGGAPPGGGGGPPPPGGPPPA